MSSYINTNEVFYDSREFARYYGVRHERVMFFIDKIRGNKNIKARFTVNKNGRNTDGVADFCLFGSKELTILQKIMFGMDIAI